MERPGWRRYNGLTQNANLGNNSFNGRGTTNVYNNIFHFSAIHSIMVIQRLSPVYLRTEDPNLPAKAHYADDNALS